VEAYKNTEFKDYSSNLMAAVRYKGRYYGPPQD